MLLYDIQIHIILSYSFSVDDDINDTSYISIYEIVITYISDCYLGHCFMILLFVALFLRHYLYPIILLLLFSSTITKINLTKISNRFSFLKLI